MTIAYTIGNHLSYDRDLALGQNNTKLGAHPARGDEPAYEGGAVWRTAYEAQRFISETVLSFPAAVYALDLPLGWDEDVSADPNPQTKAHHLIHDVPILYRVNMTLLGGILAGVGRGALLVDYAAVADPESPHPAIKGLPSDQHLWAPQLDEAYVEDDFARFMEMGLLQWHPERGQPFLSLGPAPVPG